MLTFETAAIMGTQAIVEKLQVSLFSVPPTLGRRRGVGRSGAWKLATCILFPSGTLWEARGLIIDFFRY